MLVDDEPSDWSKRFEVLSVKMDKEINGINNRTTNKGHGKKFD